MTPEPTAGIYKDRGVEFFIRKFGYPDKKGFAIFGVSFKNDFVKLLTKGADRIAGHLFYDHIKFQCHRVIDGFVSSKLKKVS